MAPSPVEWYAIIWEVRGQNTAIISSTKWRNSYHLRKAMLSCQFIENSNQPGNAIFWRVRPSSAIRFWVLGVSYEFLKGSIIIFVFSTCTRVDVSKQRFWSLSFPIFRHHSSAFWVIWCRKQLEMNWNVFKIFFVKINNFLSNIFPALEFLNFLAIWEPCFF